MLNLNNGVRGGTACLSNAGLAIGSDTADAKILAPDGEGVHYAIKGISYHKADTDDAIVFTGKGVADGYTQMFVVCLDSAGAVSLVDSNVVTIAAFDDKTAVLDWPVIPETVCPIGAIRIKPDGGAFIGATTVLSHAHAAAVYINLFTIPDGPLTA